MAQSTNKNKKHRTPARRSCIKKNYNLRSSKKSGNKKSSSKKSSSKKLSSKKSRRYHGHNPLALINKEIATVQKELLEKTDLLKQLEKDFTRREQMDAEPNIYDEVLWSNLKEDRKRTYYEVQNAENKLKSLENQKNKLIGMTPRINIADPKSPYYVQPKK